MRRPALWLLAVLLLLVPSALRAQGSKVTSAVELARVADTLKPGQWVWAPEIAPAGPLTVYVDLSHQVATVYRNGVRIGVSTVSSGKPGHETPTGVFTILQKDPTHRSKKYNDAPMPYQERLTWDGVALHAGGLPGYPESHGCVHLPLEFSRLLFGTTHLGGTVIVAGQAGQPLLVESAGVLSPSSGAAGGVGNPLRPDESFRWTPEASPSGPLTVIVSRSDQRVVAIRNGIEIGRSRVELPNEDFQTHVMTLIQPDAGQPPRWLYVGVPGHQGESGLSVDTTVMARVRMPPAFRSSLQAAIEPGATILVTQAPVLPHTTGKALTVMASAAETK